MILTMLIISAFIGGLIAFYKSRLVNHLAAHTSLQQARFSLRATTAGLVWLYVSNFLLTVLTLGIAFPLVELRGCAILHTKNEIDRHGRLSTNRPQQCEIEHNRRGPCGGI